MNAPEDAPERSREQDSREDGLLPIRRAPLQRLTIYEVEESELAILERGSPDTVFLNIAVALLSVSVSLSVALLTAISHPAEHGRCFW